jgi:CRISPR-associated protein Cas1
LETCSTDVPDLVPARMLNEFAYCPRLAYLEWVQGEFVHNLDTLEGRFGHRRVDQPTRAALPAGAAGESKGEPCGGHRFEENRSPRVLTQEIEDGGSRIEDGGTKQTGDDNWLAARPPLPLLPKGGSDQCEPIHARSLMLSAPGEGLICKIDVLELEGDVATPVDYKRGKQPDVIEGAWEPERVQVCAQGLILREAGYKSDEGVLYFIESKKRVPVIFDEDLVARTRELVAGLRQMGQEQVLPPPLVDSPKCPRCSLVGICLPDETNLLYEIDDLHRRAEAGAPTALVGPPPVDPGESETAFDANAPAKRPPQPPLAKGGSDAGEPGSGHRFEENWSSGISVFDGIEFGAHGIVEVPLQCAEGEGQVPAQRPPLPPLPKGGSDCAARPVRRLLPARDDALPLYVQEQGASVGKSGDRITVKEKGKTIQTVRLIDVSQVSVFGNVQVTAQALRELSDRGIPVCHFSYGGWLNAMTTGLIHKNVELRIRQFAVAADARQSLALARQFVVGKIKNCRTLLRRHLPDEDAPQEAPTDGPADPVTKHQTLNTKHRPKEQLLRQLAELAEQAARAPSVETLLGTEGMAAKLYFAGFARLLKGGGHFDIDGRNRRPPQDPTNALLSFVYSMLARELTVVLQAVGFDPLLGFLHRPRYGRPSLALDLAEEFRPLIADSTVLMLINNGEVGPASFICRGGAVALTTAGRRAVIEAFERRLETEVTHAIFGYRVSYRRILEVQARLLSRVLLGDLEEYPNFCTR